MTHEEQRILSILALAAEPITWTTLTTVFEKVYDYSGSLIGAGISLHQNGLMLENIGGRVTYEITDTGREALRYAEQANQEPKPRRFKNAGNAWPITKYLEVRPDGTTWIIRYDGTQDQDRNNMYSLANIERMVIDGGLVEVFE